MLREWSRRDRGGTETLVMPLTETGQKGRGTDEEQTRVGRAVKIIISVLNKRSSKFLSNIRVEMSIKAVEVYR